MKFQIVSYNIHRHTHTHTHTHTYLGIIYSWKILTNGSSNQYGSNCTLRNLKENKWLEYLATGWVSIDLISATVIPRMTHQHSQARMKLILSALKKLSGQRGGQRMGNNGEMCAKIKIYIGFPLVGSIDVDVRHFNLPRIRVGFPLCFLDRLYRRGSFYKWHRANNYTRSGFHLTLFGAEFLSFLSFPFLSFFSLVLSKSVACYRWIFQKREGKLFVQVNRLCFFRG